jgi:2-polyprenyl-3-methyl-5-hydroxy-6-metoxy-1,4-benzoquinol methylase
VDPQYGERYRELYQKHWWWRARTELIVDTIRRLQPPRGWKTILDIGCGDGLFFDRLAEFGEVEGVEPGAELVSPENPHRGRIHVRPFDDGFRPGKQYSLVLMLDVLEHLGEPAAALRHAVALLAPGGTLVATVPAFMSLWTNHDVINHHLIRYTKRTFREMASRAGLRIRQERYLYQWTCPVKLGVRLVEGIFRLEPSPPRIPANWINETLYQLSRIEEKILSLVPMPFGSSLMVVGARM